MVGGAGPAWPRGREELSGVDVGLLARRLC